MWKKLASVWQIHKKDSVPRPCQSRQGREHGECWSAHHLWPGNCHGGGSRYQSQRPLSHRQFQLQLAFQNSTCTGGRPDGPLIHTRPRPPCPLHQSGPQSCCQLLPQSRQGFAFAVGDTIPAVTAPRVPAIMAEATTLFILPITGITSFRS